jgi:hypothetical protein
MSITAMPRIRKTAVPRIYIESGTRVPAPEAGRYLPRPSCECRRRGSAS